MSSSTAINFESIEAQVRAEADRKVKVLREIVATHTTLTNERQTFLTADTDRVRALSALLAEAKASGFDAKTLKSFEIEHLTTTKQAGPRRTRRASSPKSSVTTNSEPVSGPAESVSA